MTTTFVAPVRLSSAMAAAASAPKSWVLSVWSSELLSQSL